MDSKPPEYQPVANELQTVPPDPEIVVPVSILCVRKNFHSQQRPSVHFSTLCASVSSRVHWFRKGLHNVLF